LAAFKKLGFVKLNSVANGVSFAVPDFMRNILNNKTLNNTGISPFWGVTKKEKSEEALFDLHLFTFYK